MASVGTYQVPQISFIIPAKNEKNNIGETIRVVMNHKWRIPIEVIVVDNESTDATCDIARSAGATVVTKKGGTIGEVRNRGVEESSAPILVFIDSDVSLTDEWFREINSVCRTMQENPYLITGSHCVPPDNGGWLEKHWFGKVSQEKKTTHLGTGHLLVTRELFDALGGFSAEHETGEDYDFCIRAKKSGATLVNNPALKAIHRGYPKSLREFVCREAWHGQGDTKSISTILSSKVAIVAILIFLFHILAISAFIYAPVNPVPLMAGLAGIVGLLFLSSIYKFRHAGPASIIINSAIFYFYYIGRLCSVLNLALGKRVRAS
ncbi:glycosyltransferase family 2 protein [Marinimicrobium sp. ABcell2]|uniref:glycosyltransferase n=1 Tax=Marinimicrobium sp. ABcell2 TaxID=3069751 RepID=UPI0027B3AAD6|nr:glycosyltransferase [Marinimicrobium sp. ABcell2]MDQ2076171.1 glycosyltransferase [Marinimicrobium sp. ABcell2]